MKATVDGYLAAVVSGDVDAIMALYGDDARIEDPIGAEPRIGAEILRSFFSQPRDVAEIERLGPITIFDRWAAFQFRAVLGPGRGEGMPESVALTEVMRFDDGGKILEMIAIPDVANADEPVTRKVFRRPIP